MNFSQALELIKEGKKLYRQAWGNDGEFVYLVLGSKFTVNRLPLSELYPEGTEINYFPHIDISCGNSRKEITCGVWGQNNWDLLAEDWEVIE